MYRLIPTILLILPSFGFASPAQPIDSLQLVAPSHIGPKPIDPRFTMQPEYLTGTIDEDDFLVAAVQLTGIYGSTDFNGMEGHKFYYDDDVPRVKVTVEGFAIFRLIEVRFAFWGLVLGIKGMIASQTFKEVNFKLKWNGRPVGVIEVRKRNPEPSLSGDNNNQGEHYVDSSSNALQQSSSSSSSNRTNLAASVIRIPDSTSSLNLTAPSSLTPSSSNPAEPIDLVVDNVADDIPKYNFITSILDGMLATTNDDVRAQLKDVVRAQGPGPDTIGLFVYPDATPAGSPYMTYGLSAYLIRQLPKYCLLMAHRWAEVTFRGEIEGLQVTHGRLGRYH